MNDYVTCQHCGEVSNIGGLIGPNTNDCPKCGHPVLNTLKHTVRYFVVDYDSEDDAMQWDIVEVSEHEFLKAEGEITYERHTKRENGVSQICLTKGLDQC